MPNLKSSFISKKITVPSSTESDNKKDNYVNWGDKNEYPYFINYLFQNSAIQSGIINSKVHYITSGGLNYTGPDELEFKRFFENGNSDYNLNEIAEQIAKDLELSNMFCLRGVWSLDKSRVDKLEVIDFEKVRYRLDDNNIAVSNDWTDRKETIKIIEPFNPSDRKAREFYLIYQDKGKQTVENNKVNKSIYPTPPYSGGITSILTDIKINTYQLTEISSGFSTGTIINLNSGQPANEEEKRDLERDIQDNSTGERNAGGVMVLYNLGKENEASVLNVSGNDLKDRYLALSKDNRNNIILSHSITTPILFGIKTEGGLGNATELEIGYKIMKANYFKYKQRAILSALNEIAKKGNGLQGKIEFNEVNLDFLEQKEEVIEAIPQQQPAQFKSDIDVVAEFNKCGIPKPQNVVYSRALPNEFNADEEDAKAIEEFSKSKFAVLDNIQSQVLALVREGHTFDNIAEALNVDSQKLTNIYKTLETNGLVKDGKITVSGLGEIAKQDVSKIKIYYSYEKNPAVSGPSILPNNRTREFCTDMVTLSRSKVWSRDDINLISAFVGRDCFTYRGGFWNQGNGKTTPWCRHVWMQQLVYL